MADVIRVASPNGTMEEPAPQSDALVGSAGEDVVFGSNGTDPVPERADVAGDQSGTTLDLTDVVDFLAGSPVAEDSGFIPLQGSDPAQAAPAFQAAAPAIIVIESTADVVLDDHGNITIQS
jgi:hypothetical protein